MSFKIELVRKVSNLSESIAWYEQNLSAEANKKIENDMLSVLSKILDKDNVKATRIFIGIESFLLVEDTSYRVIKSLPIKLSFQHLAVIVRDSEAIFKTLTEKNVDIHSTGVQMIPESNKIAGGIKVAYLYDNSSYPIALVEYPKNKGKAKWQDKSGKFLGIDHSAIRVGSIDESLKWYESLGYKVDVEDHRKGHELVDLTQIRNAEIKIIGLEASNNYGIELIEYLNPLTNQDRGDMGGQIIIVSGDVVKEGLQRDPSGHIFYFIN